MSIIRQNADGTNIIIPDGNITRKLNALAKMDKNKVLSGLTVTGLAGPYQYAISAGTAVVGGAYREFAAIPTITATVGGITTATGVPYVTFYIASGCTAPSIMNSGAYASYPPGSATIGQSSYVLLAHMKNAYATYGTLESGASSRIDNQVKPKLFSDNLSWDKRKGF